MRFVRLPAAYVSSRSVLALAIVEHSVVVVCAMNEVFYTSVESD